MDWQLPSPDRVIAACDATWPPLSQWRLGPWLIREGGGGGGRVSAARHAPGAPEPDARAVREAMEAMLSLGQSPLFCVPQGATALDAVLEAEGFTIAAPVAVLAVAAAALPDVDPMTAIAGSHPLARLRQIWDGEGIGPARLAVMARAPDPKTYLIARHQDRPAGAAFVGMADGIAVMHALAIRQDQRRTGLGRAMTCRAGAWAARQGAGTLAVLVTRANAPANALYRALGFREVAGYHYRAGGQEIAGSVPRG